MKQNTLSIDMRIVIQRAMAGMHHAVLAKISVGSG